MRRRSRRHPGEMEACARRMLEGSRARLLQLGHAREELRRCLVALRRLEDGSWGTCEACAAAIGRNRLLAIPEATTCASCEARAARGPGEPGADEAPLLRKAA